MTNSGLSGGRISAAIVGLGRIASLLEDDALREKPCTHAGALSAHPDVILAAGADIDGERRELFGKRWNCPVYAGAEAMLKEVRPELLCVATHPDSHLEYCRLAAAYGVKTVVCEKPLADSLSSARKIAALHRQGRIKIITNHERRYAADYLRAKALIDEGRLGDLLGISAVLYMGKTRRMLDVLWHDGTHLADAAMFLSGRVLTHRKRWGTALEKREGTSFLLGDLIPGSPASKGPDTGGTIPYMMEIGAGRDHLVFELECSCSQGRIRIGNGVFEIWESGPSPYAEGFRSLKNTGEVFDGPTGYFSNMIADAAACTLDISRQPRSSAEDGLRVIEYLASIKRWKK